MSDVKSQEDISKTKEENPNFLLIEPEEDSSVSEESEEIESDLKQEESLSIEAEELMDTKSVEETVTEIETDVIGQHSNSKEGILPYFIIGEIVLSVAILGLVLLLLFKRKRKRMSNIEENANTLSSEFSNQKTVKILKTAKNCPVKVASIHDVGKRNAQQDSFGFSDVKDEVDMEQKGVLAIVADGMGGLSDGDRISQMVVVTMLKGFDEDRGVMPTASLLLRLVHEANIEVNKNLGEEKIGKCGSTITAAIIKNYKLSWISVGDSHIYVCRKGKLVKMNRDHNYAAELDEMVKNGELTMEEAMNNPQRSALTSFIGMGELEQVDQNENPIALQKEDRILLMSDGVFGTIPELRIAEIMNMPLLRACEQMEREIREKNKHNQDNYTCVVLEVI